MSPAAFLGFLGKILANLELCVLGEKQQGHGGRKGTAEIPTLLPTARPIRGDQRRTLHWLCRRLQDKPPTPGLSALSKTPSPQGGLPVGQVGEGSGELARALEELRASEVSPEVVTPPLRVP